MKSITTLILFVAVVLLGSYIVFVEQRLDSTGEKEAAARRALQVKADGITSLRIEADNLQLECEKTAKGWYLKEPVEARADDGEVDRVLYQLETLVRGEIITLKERKDKGLSLKDYGLEDPRVRLILGVGDVHRTLSIGRDAPLGPDVYIKEDGRPEILAVGKKLLDVIPSDVSTFREVALFPFERSAVKRIGIRRADGFLQLAQTGTGIWTIQQPIVGRANAVEVIRLLDELFQLQIDQFVADNVGDPAAYGLTDPQVQVTLWTDGQDAGRTLMLGGALGDESDLIYAKWESEDSVYAISRASLDWLSLGLTALRERSLLPFLPQSIASVRISEGERQLLLSRDGEEGWRIVEPRQDKADDTLVQSLLERWSRVRIEDYVDDTGTNLSHYGLASPALTIEFSPRIRVASTEMGSGAASGGTVVHVGTISADGRVLVKLKSEPSVYAVTEDSLDGISLEPLDFRDRRILHLRKEDVERISRIVGTSEQTVKRDADTDVFMPVPGREGLVDADALASMLDSVCPLTAEQFVTDSTASLADYGLETPRAVVTLDLRGDAGLSKTILLGHASNGQFYAVIRGQDVIFTLNSQQEAVLTQSLFISTPDTEENASDAEKEESEGR